jgi:hypothetical protein
MHARLNRVHRKCPAQQVFAFQKGNRPEVSDGERAQLEYCPDCQFRVGIGDSKHDICVRVGEFLCDAFHDVLDRTGIVCAGDDADYGVGPASDEAAFSNSLAWCFSPQEQIGYRQPRGSHGAAILAPSRPQRIHIDLKAPVVLQSVINRLCRMCRSALPSSTHESCERLVHCLPGSHSGILRHPPDEPSQCRALH